MNRVNIINLIQEKYNFLKYLEIGVRRTEDCFDHIKCQTKHSVDPGFENPNNPATYPFTSDEFFNQLNQNQLNLPSNYIWVSQNQLIKMIKKKKFDIEGRLLFGCLNISNLT